MVKRIAAEVFRSTAHNPTIAVEFAPVRRCPLCLTSLNGEFMSANLVSSDPSHPLLSESRLYVSHYCDSCGRGFLGVYSEEGVKSEDIFALDFCAPQKDSQKKWPKEIQGTFNEFVVIYDEAWQAELQGLTNICGMGYRKALERLIKDYLINIAGNDAKEIAGMSLGKCIKDKIDNPKIQIVASRSAWLGNDHSHYQTRFEEFNLNDLKSLIDAVAYWISIEIITRNAAEMQPR